MRLYSLKDLDATAGTVPLHSSTNVNGIVLQPPPNEADPNDPLRWPRWKKYACFLSVCIFAFNLGYSVSGLSPALYLISIEFDLTSASTQQLLVWPFLVLGLFNYVWIPLANYYGKRPVLIFTSLLLAVGQLWGALSKTFGSLLWSVLLSSAGGSAVEPLGLAIANDLFFLHERSHALSVYTNIFGNGLSVGSLICGFVASQAGWRWYKWTAFILAALDWVAIVLLCPETMYDRPKIAALPMDVSTQEKDDHIGNTGHIESKTFSQTQLPATASEGPDDSQVPLKPYWRQLSLLSSSRKDKNLLILFLRPFPMMAYPAVILAFLTSAVALAWTISVSAVNPFVLQAPPYNWKADVNGLINICGIIGNVLGAWIGGWLVDKYSLWRSRNNPNGTHQPESRLHMLIIPGLLVPSGCLLFGYAAANHMHWIAIFFACGMVFVGLTSILSIAATYVSDCYLPINADALLLLNGMKNLFTFGFLYGIFPWVTSAGYIHTFGAQAGIFVGIMLLVVPFVIWGHRIRSYTAGWRILLGESSTEG